jgi:hypothetical protein
LRCRTSGDAAGSEIGTARGAVNSGCPILSPEVCRRDTGGTYTLLHSAPRCGSSTPDLRPMSRNRWFAFTLTVLAATITAYLVFRSSAPAADPTRSQQEVLPGWADSRTASERDQHASASKRPATADTPPSPATLEHVDMAQAPLPPADAIVADVYEDLMQRARQGDTRAACRLGRELQNCQALAARIPSLDDVERYAVLEPDPERSARFIEQSARQQVAYGHANRLCAGLTQDQLSQAFALQMQAARANPALRVWAISKPALDDQYFVDQLDLWQEYRRVAMPWLESAAAEGNLTAIVLLMRIHGDGRRQPELMPPFRQLDDQRFVMYADLLERHGLSIPEIQKAAARARAGLSTSAQAEAMAKSRALYRQTEQPVLSLQEQRFLMQSPGFGPPAGECD